MSESQKNISIADLYNNLLRNPFSSSELKNLASQTSSLNDYESKLSQLEQFFFNLKPSNEDELKLWLIKSISSLQVKEETKLRKFMKPFYKMTENSRKWKTSEKDYSRYIQQTLVFICQNHPTEVATLLANHHSQLREFFTSDESRMLKWFSFEFSGKNERGGLALEQWLFFNREAVWDKLRWTGKRNVPPVIAIQKKNMLLELDLIHLLTTISKFYSKEAKEALLQQQKESKEEGELDEKEEDDIFPKKEEKSELEKQLMVEDFWESDFFKNSLKSGEFLQMDYQFFANQLEKMLNTGGKERDQVLDVVELYFKKESFPNLCQKLLLLLDDSSLLSFIYHLDSSTFSNSSLTKNEVNIIILCECKWPSLDSPLFYNAILNSTKAFHKLLKENENEYLKFEKFISQNYISTPTSFLQQHWLYFQSLEGKTLLSTCRFAVLETFIVFYLLVTKAEDRESLEKVMKQENISFSPVTNSQVAPTSKKRNRSEQFLGWKINDEGIYDNSDIQTILSKKIFQVILINYFASVKTEKEEKKKSKKRKHF